MPDDTTGRLIEVGDTVRIPDHHNPWNADATRYGSRCRHGLVTQVWNDGVVAVMMRQMYDFRDLTRDPFTMGIDLYGSDVTIVRDTSGAFLNAPDYEATTPHVSSEQPRDERGRFMAMHPEVSADLRAAVTDDEFPPLDITFTPPPSPVMTDTVMAEWIRSLRSQV